MGGLADHATIPLIRSAMIPFGNVRSVDMPRNYVEGTHRGFCFVEYDDPEDADEAIYNMDGAELLGKTLSVSLAQPNQVNKLTSSTNEAIWKSDEWFQQQMANDVKARAEAEQKQQDASVLQQD